MLVIWIAIVAILGAGAATFIKPGTSAISIPGTEAQKTLDRYKELFPGNGSGSARIVFAVPEGKTVTDYKSQIDTLSNEIADVKDVALVVSPFTNEAAISKDKTIAYASVQVNSVGGSVSDDTITAVAEKIEAAKKDGLVIEMGGDLVNHTPGELVGPGEIGGVLIALIVLVITLGSLVAAGMPVIVALVTIAASMAGLFSLSQLIDINSTTPALAVMLGLAVGIDYSLFIINRYKSLLLEGYDNKTAIGRAVSTAGNAVIFAAATVVIALSALSIVQIPFMTTMGLAGAATVAIAAIVAVTLVPALLSFAGNRAFGRKTKQTIIAAQAAGPHHTEHVKHRTFWYRWGRGITRHPVKILIIAVAVIAVIALPIKDLKLGLPVDEFAASSSTQRKAYDLVAKGFGDGANGPLLLVVEGLPATTEADKTAVRTQIMAEYTKQVQAATEQQMALFEQRAAAVKTPAEAAALQQEAAAAQAAGAAQQQAALAQIEAQVEQYAPYYQLTQVANRIAELDDVDQALGALTTDNGTKGVIQVIPDSAPSAQETIDLISYLRDPVHQKELSKADDVSFGVTGSTALQLDINEKLSNALPLYLGVVVGLSLILLIIAFRSILVPLKATAGFLLSVLAMFGALVAVFQWGWFGITDAPGPIISFIPILAIGILFGLAMDYEFFLVSSIHEAHLHTKDAKKAVMRGFSLGSKVVTAAGIIMVSVFAGFISNHDATIQSIGFGLTVGILVDAFIVRMTIVPAVMTLLGNHAWWIPKWLDRILPHISIEGDAKPVAKK